MAPFYRIIRNDQPSLDDFKSHAALGRTRPPSVPPRAWAGTSLHDTLAASRTLARRRIEMGKPLGHYIARLELPARIERQLDGRDGHHSVWAPPGDLLACVSGVVAVMSEATFEGGVATKDEDHVA